MKKYYIAHPDGTQRGPILEQNLVTMVKTGKLSPDTLCWREGMPDWELLEKVIELPELGEKEAPAVVAEKKERPSLSELKASLTETCGRGGGFAQMVLPQLKLRAVNVSRSLYRNVSGGFVTMLRERHRLSGCAGRSEYWWAYAGIILCYLAVKVLYGTVNFLLSFCPLELVVGICKVIVALPVVVGWCYLVRPFVALTVRRLRDVGLPTRWAWLLIVHPFNFVFIAVSLMLLVELGGSMIGAYVFMLLTLGSFLFFIITAMLPTKSVVCDDDASLMTKN